MTKIITYVTLIVIYFAALIADALTLGEIGPYNSPHNINGIEYWTAPWGFSAFVDTCKCDLNSLVATENCCNINGYDALCENTKKLLLRFWKEVKVAAADVCHTARCPDGYYNADHTATCDNICPEGYMCPIQTSDGNLRFARVNHGFYSPQGASFGAIKASRCPAGSYCRWEINGGIDVQDNNSQFFKRTCMAGHKCPEGTTYPIRCAAGTFCQQGSSVEAACTAGMYCPDGTTSEIICPKGNYCPPSSGSPITCKAGTYCPNDGMTSPFPCPEKFYCDADQLSAAKPCQGGYYCPANSINQIECPSTKYCPPSSSSPIICTIGSYCPSGTSSPVECPSGYYCPSAGASSPTECPLGYYCAITGSSTPTGECTASIPCSDDLLAGGKAACAGAASNDCYRHLSVRSVSKISAISMSSLIASADANAIYRVDLNGIFNQFGKKGDTYLVTGGKHLIIDCHDDYLQNFLSFNGSNLTLDANVGKTMNKIVFRHCVVLDINLQLNSNSMIILHDSTIDYKSMNLTTVDLTKGPAYIVVDDESHIIGLDAIKGNDISSKVMIIQDGSTPNAVFGCDKMLTCNSAPFVNNLGVYTDTYKKYFNYIATSLYANTTAYQLPNDAIASSDFQKRMVFQSQLSCGLYANQYHDRSVYFASAVYCAVEDQTVEDSQYLEKIFIGVAYVNSTKTLAGDEQILIRSILRAIQMRYDEVLNLGFISNEVITAPRVTPGFLTSVTSPEKYSIPVLSKSLVTASKNLDDMQLQLRDRVIDITGMLDLGYALDQSRKDLALTQTRNFVSLFQGFKSESILANKTAGVAYDNLMLKLEYTKKLAENSKKQATSYSGALDELMSTLPDEISKKIKDAEEKRLKAAKTKKIINIIKATLYAAAAIAACAVVGAVVAPGTIVIAGATAAGAATGTATALTSIAYAMQATIDATSIDPMISTLRQGSNCKASNCGY